MAYQITLIDNSKFKFIKVLGMISLKKVLRDLLQEKRRTFTVVFAIILGVFAVAMMSNSKTLLDNNLTENFLRTNPASFSLYTNSIDTHILHELQNEPEIEMVETRQSVWVRMQNNDGSYTPILLYILPNIEKSTINTFGIDEGKLPALENEILFERTGKKLTPLSIGEDIAVIFPGIESRQMKISGFTHDAGIAPSWMEGYLYGYIDQSMVPAELLRSTSIEMKFTVANDKFSRPHIENVAQSTLKKLETKGITILRSEIHEPGVHMHQKQMNALMFLVLNFGILALILSCFLILNMMSAIMSKEIRQIAIMKATGATSWQISKIYLLTVGILTAIATLVGLPLGLMAGKAFATFNASMLNFELFFTDISPTVFVVVLLSGVFFPLLISVFPIVKASKVSIQQSLNDVGVTGNGKATAISRFLSRVVSSSILLSARNAFRRKTRLALTVLSLSLGGAIFITSLNIQASTDVSIEKNFDQQPQDLMYVLSKPQSASKLKEISDSIHGTSIEVGMRSTGSFALENDLNSGSFAITALKEDTKMIVPDMLEGKWLSGNSKEIVINQITVLENPQLTVGSKVGVEIKGKTEAYTIVGICKQMFTPPAIFLTDKDFANHTGASIQAGNLLFVNVQSSLEKDIVAANIQFENMLEQKSISVASSVTKVQYKKAVVEHLLIIMAMLITMTLLVIIVGGLGMVTSIGINVSERKREVGILSSIGIQNKSLRNIIITEGLTMGMISWAFATLLSVPLSIYLGNSFFSIFFESVMGFELSYAGVGIWLALTILISYLSSLVPANRSIKMPVAVALSYE